MTKSEKNLKIVRKSIVAKKINKKVKDLMIII